MSTTRIMLNLLAGTAAGLIGTAAARGIGLTSTPGARDAAKIGAIGGALVTALEISHILLLRMLTTPPRASMVKLIKDHYKVDEESNLLSTSIAAGLMGCLLTQKFSFGSKSSQQAIAVFAMGGFILSCALNIVKEGLHHLPKGNDPKSPRAKFN